MWLSFFTLAAQSPGRQWAFHRALVAHLVVLAGCAWMLDRHGAPAQVGYVLLVLGIVEGAAMVGWRLVQLPRSQALEFLLVSSLRPAGVLTAEALVGLARLALVTLSGLPVLIYLVAVGELEAVDVGPLLVMPFTWGAVTGLGLTMWSYEPLAVRRWAERGFGVLILAYLGLGVLAGEHLRTWVTWLPSELGRWFLGSFAAFHRDNPFAVLEYWFTVETNVAVEQMLALEVGAGIAAGLFLARAAFRLKGHFHDRHYRPNQAVADRCRGKVGDKPLSWWAVRRVTEYAGRINLWLAGGFGVAYALYTVFQASWPSWMGQSVFQMFNQVGGIPTIATALVVLAAVPAAFQYGLWDSNVQERCRRLELLLLTRLEARDYWDAAAAAAWRRGRGYFAVAMVLWSAAALAGQLGVAAVAAMAAGVVLWGLYFALGFRAFARGLQANGLGLVLTVGLPLVAYLFYRLGWPAMAGLVPPGSVYASAASPSSLAWGIGSVAAAVSALLLARLALARCDGELRAWYERHQGQKV
jgi:hypothetical protein